MQNSRELERKTFEAEGHINKNSFKNSGLTSKQNNFPRREADVYRNNHCVSQETNRRI
jgi:hypothetical protein